MACMRNGMCGKTWSEGVERHGTHASPCFQALSNTPLHDLRVPRRRGTLRSCRGVLESAWKQGDAWVPWRSTPSDHVLPHIPFLMQAIPFLMPHICSLEGHSIPHARGLPQFQFTANLFIKKVGIFGQSHQHDLKTLPRPAAKVS